MPDEQGIICEACRERLATIHTTIVVEENVTTKDLCEECWQRSASTEELAAQRAFAEKVRTSKCKYCGDAATGGSGWSSYGTESETDFWCQPCGADYSEFMSRPENVVSDEIPDEPAALEEHLRRLKAIQAAAEAYVRQRARERKQ